MIAFRAAGTITWLRLSLLVLTAQFARSGEVYGTSFEEFDAGPDQIVAEGSWAGSHAGQDRHGILAPEVHAVPGIGNAAYIGGNPQPVLSGSALINVRKPMHLDPVAAGSEILIHQVLFGIQDSAADARDNFEFAVYNEAGELLAAIHFDNSTPDPETGKPFRGIYRAQYNRSSASFVYLSTGAVFFYDTLHSLLIRINFRTNLWTAEMDGVPLFADAVFHDGPRMRNAGSIAAQCRLNSLQTPGTNYMLFDDWFTSVTAPGTPVPEVQWTANQSAELRFHVEAGYSYEVHYSTDLLTWLTDLEGSSIEPAVSGYGWQFTDPAGGQVRRFYRILQRTPGVSGAAAEFDGVPDP